LRALFALEGWGGGAGALEFFVLLAEEKYLEIDDCITYTVITFASASWPPGSTLRAPGFPPLAVASLALALSLTLFTTTAATAGDEMSAALIGRCTPASISLSTHPLEPLNINILVAKHRIILAQYIVSAYGMSGPP
jgi:hypothetical protein